MEGSTVEAIEGPAVDGCVVELDRPAVGRKARPRVGDRDAIELESAAVGGFHYAKVGDAPAVHEQCLTRSVGVNRSAHVILENQAAIADDPRSLDQVVHVLEGDTAGLLLDVNTAGAGFGHRQRAATRQ